MDAAVRKNEYGYFELVEKPTLDVLKAYYAEKYYQNAEGSYEVSYSDAEKSYFGNKVAQKLLAATQYIKLPTGGLPTFLDVGAGEGWSLAHFHDLGWECVGLDFSSFGCSQQNPQVLQHLTAGDIYGSLSDLASAGRRFDLILLDNVLEHVLDPFGLLTKLRELLEPQGVLIVDVPNDFSVLQEHLLEKGYIDNRFWVVAPDHISYFGPESLAALVRAAGWKVQTMMTDFPIDFSLANPLTNYARDGKVGKSCHEARVEIENLMHAISPEKTVVFYEALANLGLGRALTAVLSMDS
jgi:2-polyprenyl-3-methyl-5-hydroxy-6-metoxy-1,4-benzoquinol methylase